MEKHVVSLELCKQLRDAGYENLKGFYWVKNRYAKVGEWYVAEKVFGGTPSPDYFDEYVAAPLADEILEQLPARMKNGDELEMIKYPEKYIVGYWHEADQWDMAEEGVSVADAAAKMWLYLKKEGLL